MTGAIIGVVIILAIAVSILVPAVNAAHRRGGHAAPPPERNVVTPTPGDQRQDLVTRTRIAELEARWRAVARIMYVGAGAVVAGVAIAVVGLILLYARIQASRQEASARSCFIDDRHNRGIQRFVLSRARPGTPPADARQLRADLNRDFPVITPVDPADDQARDREADRRARDVCAARARAIVDVGP